MALFRTTRRQRLEAQAFRDALRDILATEGIVSLADERRLDTLYHFDGVRWMREQLPPRERRPMSFTLESTSPSLDR